MGFIYKELVFVFCCIMVIMKITWEKKEVKYLDSLLNDWDLTLKPLYITLKTTCFLSGGSMLQGRFVKSRQRLTSSTQNTVSVWALSFFHLFGHSVEDAQWTSIYAPPTSVCSVNRWAFQGTPPNMKDVVQSEQPCSSPRSAQATNWCFRLYIQFTDYMYTVCIFYPTCLITAVLFTLAEKSPNKCPNTTYREAHKHLQFLDISPLF